MTQSKDNNLRLFDMKISSEPIMLKKRDIRTKYTDKISTFNSRKSKDYYLMTTSKDKMLKSWEVSNVNKSNFWLVNKVKDSWINSMSVAPNGKTLFCASYEN